MRLELLQARSFALGLAVTDADEGDDRGHIAKGHRPGVLVPELPGRDEAAEDPRVILRHALHIAPGIERRKLRRAELLKRHHPAEAADGLVVERVEKDLPDLFQQPVLRDAGKDGDILPRVLHVDVDPVGVRLILRGRRLHDRVKDGALAGKMVVERRGLDPHGRRDLADADRVVAMDREQLQCLGENFLPGILLLHPCITAPLQLTNVR